MTTVVTSYRLTVTATDLERVVTTTDDNGQQTSQTVESLATFYDQDAAAAAILAPGFQTQTQGD